MSVRMVVADDQALTVVSGWLDRAGLPSADLRRPECIVWVFEDAAGLIGCGGLDGSGDDRLLRSLVVLSNRRGAGLGGCMVEMIEGSAWLDGARCLHLLTQGAQRFFQAHGYEIAERTSAPPVIAATEQFARLCPSNAAYLLKRRA